jgi:hypothetical protein
LQTPKRSPAIRPNVVPAREAYARANMENIRHINNLSFENDVKAFSRDLDAGMPLSNKVNGVSGESGDLMRSKSSNNASVPSSVSYQ